MGLWHSDVTATFLTSKLDHWYRKEVNDLLEERGCLLVFANIQNHYNMRGNGIDNLLLILSVEPAVRREVQKGCIPATVIHPFIYIALSRPKGVGQWYRLLTNSQVQETKLREGYRSRLISEQLWPDSYCTVSRYSRSTFYAVRHDKSITRICATNLQRFCFGIKDSPLCECNTNFTETVENGYFYAHL